MARVRFRPLTRTVDLFNKVEEIRSKEIKIDVL